MKINWKSFSWSIYLKRLFKINYFPCCYTAPLSKMGSAGYINISCIFWVIKKNRVQIISHGDNYCMKKVIELLITSCAHCRRFSLKDRGKEKWKAKTSRFIFLMLIMHKKLLLILVLHFRERLFSPCSLSQITNLAPLWIWTSCLFLFKTDTTESNSNIYLEDISGLKIIQNWTEIQFWNHKRRKTYQINDWETQSKKRTNKLVSDDGPQISLFPRVSRNLYFLKLFSERDTEII